MKILVPTKRVVDTDQRISVRNDELGIDDDHLPFVINPFDAIAVEEALRIQESRSENTEIVTVGIGPEPYESELRTGLAMGADRAIWVETADLLDPWGVANTLAALVKQESPQLVLLGKQAVDDDSNQAGQFLAAILDWPQATFASKVELDEDRLHVSRETDLGIERLSVELPAVVTADLRLNEPRYASLPSILRAKKKTIEHLSIADLSLSWEPKIEIVKMVASSSSRSCELLETPEDFAQRLRDEFGPKKNNEIA